MNGILVVDKEKDMTSRDVVNLIGKCFHTKKVGHTGTLDPNATGVLVLCLGESLKLVDMITADEKEYVAEIILGISTDTLDVTGTVLKCETVDIEQSEIEEALTHFIGSIKQEVPLYSSVKVEGRRLYEYARRNESVILPIRDVFIKEIFLCSEIKKEAEQVSFEIKCLVSKGTYIRSLARDIGKYLGVPSCMGNLRRIKQGNFSITESYSLEQIKNNEFTLIPMTEVLKEYKTIVVSKELEFKIKNGQIIDRLCEEDICILKNEEEQILAIYQTYHRDIHKMKPYKMF